MPQISSSPTVSIRPATEQDEPALLRLAALDSAAVPAGPLLLGLVGDRTAAALSLTTGAVIADPFLPTAGVVELLRVRAGRLRPGSGPARGIPRRPAWAPGGRRRPGPLSWG